MDWRRWWHGIKEPPRQLPHEAHRADLLQQLRASGLREERLMQALAEKDRQIGLVLEAQFYRPVVATAKGGTAREPMFDADSLNDVAVFEDAAQVGESAKGDLQRDA